MSTIPEWITSQLRARGLCECCGQQPAATTWAGTGQEICWDCCETKTHLTDAELDRMWTRAAAVGDNETCTQIEAELELRDPAR